MAMNLVIPSRTSPPVAIRFVIHQMAPIRDFDAQARTAATGNGDQLRVTQSVALYDYPEAFVVLQFPFCFTIQ